MMNHYQRADRVAALLQQEVSRYLLQESGVLLFQRMTITSTKMSSDLKYATLFYSVLGDQSIKAEVGQTIADKLKNIRRHIASALNLRYVPEIRFEFDDSIEYAAHIESLLQKIKK